MHIFPPIGKNYAYFSPIDLIFTKLQKKLNIFRLRRASPQYNKFPLGKKYEGGGGQKYEFQI